MTHSIIVKTTAAFSLTLALAGIAVAADPTDPKVVVNHVTVRYGDLNISNKSGATSLFRRLESAATWVCGGKPGSAPIAIYSRLKRNFDACRTQAMQIAVTTVDHPMVTLAYADKDSALARVARR